MGMPKILSGVGIKKQSQDYLDTYFGKQLKLATINKVLGTTIPIEFPHNKTQTIIKPPIINYITTILGKYNYLKSVGVINFNIMLGPKTISTMQFKSLGFKNNFFLRYNDNNNLKDILDIYNDSKIDSKLEIIYKALAAQLNVAESISKKIIMDNSLSLDLRSTNKERHNQIYRYLKTVSDVLYDNLDLDIIFLYIEIDNFKANYITSDKTTKIPKKSFMIYVNPLSDIDGLVYFNFVLKVNLVDNALNGNAIEGELLDTIYTNFLNKPLTSSSIDDVRTITYNPYDKDEPLRVIEITNDDRIQKRFLLGNGPSYNLYLDDDSTNKLVGRLEFIDKSILKTNIVWCVDYDF